MLKIIKSSVAILLAASIFVGCGSDEPTASAPLLPDAVEAEASLATGEALAQNLVVSVSAGSSLNSVDNDTEGVNTAQVTATTVSTIVNRLKTLDLGSSLNAVQDLTYSGDCFVSGTFSQSGTIDDATYAINVTTSMSNCDDGYGYVANGSITIQGNLDIFGTGTGTISVSVPATYTVTEPSGFYMSIYAGTSVSMELTTTQMILTQTIKVDYNGALYGSENTRWVLGLADYSAYQTSGREYLNNLTAYIDYDVLYDMSVTPFISDVSGNITSGTTRYTHSSGALIQLTVTGLNTVLVELDTDADGTYESSSTVTVVVN